MLKKVIMILIFWVLVPSCQMFLVDSSEWKEPSAKKGNADYYEKTFSANDVLTSRKHPEKIGSYYINMPENYKFRYGSTVFGTDVLFGKKRKYLYDIKNNLGSEIYLIEGNIKNFNTGLNDIIGQKGERYRFKRITASSSVKGLLIKIKEDLYIACKERKDNSYEAMPACEAIVKIMKE